ncbi:MAG: O-antigen ligase family protein [Bacteroidaceae bacterium]|nr:O-antigen ligase family protein [Bacteroidaceae bacterium]
MTMEATDNRHLAEHTLPAIALLGLLVWTVLQPVEAGWSGADALLARAVPIVGTAGAAIALWRRGFLCLSPTDRLIGVWLLAVLLRVWLDDGYPCHTFVLRTLLMAALYTALRLFFTAVPADGRWLAAAVILCAAWEALLGMRQCAGGGSRHHMYLMTGTFQNPGPYALLPAMGVVMCAQWMAGAGPRLRRLLWMPLLLCAAVLPATWSRAAWVAAAAGLAAVMRRRWWRWRWPLAALALAAAAALYLMKQGSADGRALIYSMSLRSMAQHPWLGSGTGSFFHQYATQMAATVQQTVPAGYDSAGVPEYAFNELLRIGVEQGLTGMLMAVAVAASVTWRLWRRCRPLAVGTVAMMVFAMFSYPLALLPYQIIVVTMAAWAGTKQPVTYAGSDTAPSLNGRAGGGSSDQKKSGGRPWAILPAALLPVALALPLAGAIREHRQAEQDYGMMAGMRDRAFTDDYYRLLPMLGDNPRFLFDFGKMLSEQERWNDSNAILRQGERVSADPMFLVVQGNNYRAMKAWAEAEAMYRRAFCIQPNRLYPLYRLMLLYEEAGQEDRMRDMARTILDFRPKVESPATREMKEQARRRLRASERPGVRV